MLDAFIIKNILDRLKKKGRRRPRPQIPIKEYLIYPEKDKNHQEDEERGVVIIDMR